MQDLCQDFLSDYEGLQLPCLAWFLQGGCAALWRNGGAASRPPSALPMQDLCHEERLPRCVLRLAPRLRRELGDGITRRGGESRAFIAVRQGFMLLDSGLHAAKSGCSMALTRNDYAPLRCPNAPYLASGALLCLTMPHRTDRRLASRRSTPPEPCQAVSSHE